MNQSINAFPVFKENQVLTHSHLNSAVNYLDHQIRRTRSQLTGIGIICGFEIKSSAGAIVKTITITKGKGITSDGYLIQFGEDCDLSVYRKYNLPKGVTYPPFEDVDLYEMRKEASNNGMNDWIELEKFPHDLKEYCVLLFMECRDHESDSCFGKSCDETGGTRNFAVRKLLVHQNKLQQILEIFGDVTIPYRDKFDLPEIILGRPFFKDRQREVRNYAQFFHKYRLKISETKDKLFQLMKTIFDIYEPLLKEEVNKVYFKQLIKRTK